MPDLLICTSNTLVTLCLPQGGPAARDVAAPDNRKHEALLHIHPDSRGWHGQSSFSAEGDCPLPS